MEKFKGNVGLCENLYASYGKQAQIKNYCPKESEHYRANFKDEETKGIIGDEVDIEWRTKRFGQNEYTNMKAKSFCSLVKEFLNDGILKVLIAASLLCVVL